MKLDRNINPDGRGKYALIKLREGQPVTCELQDGLDYVCVPPSAVDFGNTPETDFFVIRLKDKYAAPALKAYADAVFADTVANDKEYSAEIYALAQAAERMTPKHMPD